VAIHGRSYASRIVDQDLSTSYPEAKSDLFNIGVLHSSLDGRPGHASYAPCSLGSLRAKHYQYWALGHVHAREIVSQDPWVVFPGNPQGRHAREIGPKGCVLVTVDENEVTGAEMRALDVVRWTHCRVDLSCAVSVAQGLDLSGQALAKEVMDSEGRLLAARVELVGATATHRELAGARERLIAELRSLAADRWGDEVWIEKVVIATRPEAARRSDDPTVETVARWIRPLDALREDTELVDGLVRELAELQGRLPVELTGAGVFEPLEIASPEAVKRLLGEARELLLSRLLPERG
jgi:DNA repair exonuclease SbcCD nuclease subunit